MTRISKRQWEDALRGLQPHDWAWLREFRGGELARLAEPTAAFDTDGRPTLELLRRLGDRGFTLPDRAEAFGMGFILAELEDHFGERNVKNPRPEELLSFARHASEQFGRAAAMLLFIFVANLRVRATPLVRHDWNQIAQHILGAETRWDPDATEPIGAHGTDAPPEPDSPPSPDADTEVIHSAPVEESPDAGDRTDHAPETHAPHDKRRSAPGHGNAGGTSRSPQQLRQRLEATHELAESLSGPVQQIADAVARAEILPAGHEATLLSLAAYHENWSELVSAVRPAGGSADPSPTSLSALEAEIDRISARAAAERERSQRRTLAAEILAAVGRPDLAPDDSLSDVLIRIAGKGPRYWEDNRDLVDPLLPELGPVTLLAILEHERATETLEVLDHGPSAEPAPSHGLGGTPGPGDAESPMLVAPGQHETRSNGPDPDGVSSPARPEGSDGRPEIRAEDATIERPGFAPEPVSSATSSARTHDDSKGSTSGQEPATGSIMARDRPSTDGVSAADQGFVGESHHLETLFASTGMFAEVGWLREAALTEAGQPDGDTFRRGWHVAAVALDSGPEPNDENAQLAASALEDLSELPHSLEQDMPRVLGLAGLRLNLAHPYRVNPAIVESLLREANWAPHHEEFVDALVRLMRNGQGLGGDREAHHQATLDRVRSLAAEAQSVIDKAPHQRKVYHRASRVWWRAVEQRSDLADMTALAGALRIMTLDPGDAPDLRLVSQVADMDSDALAELIDDVDSGLASTSPVRRPIEGTAREQLVEAMGEVVDLARRYRELRQQMRVASADGHSADERRTASLRSAAALVSTDVAASPSDCMVTALAAWATSDSPVRAASRPASDLLLLGMLRIDGFSIDPSTALSDPFNTRALSLPDRTGFEGLLELGPETETSLRQRVRSLTESAQVLEAAILLGSLEHAGLETTVEHTVLLNAIDQVMRENHTQSVEGRASLEMLNTWVNEDREEVDRVLGSFDTIDVRQSTGTLAERASRAAEIRKDLDAAAVRVDAVIGRAADDIRLRLDRVHSASQRQEIEHHLDHGDLAKAISLFVKSQWEDEDEVPSSAVTQLLRDFVSNYLPYIEQASQALGDEWPDGALTDGSRKTWATLSRQLQPLSNPDDHDIRGWINEILGMFGLKLVVNSKPRPDVARLMDHRKLELRIVAAKFQGIPGLSSTADKVLPMVVHRPVRRAAAAIEEVLDQFDRHTGVLVYLGRLSEVERRQIAERARSKPVQMLLVDRTLVEFAAEKGLRPSEALPLALAFSAGQPYAPFARGSIPPGMFYGRRGEAKDILQQNENFFVSGGRQLGKSALLKHVLEEFARDEDHVAVFLDVEGSEASGDQPYRLWSALAEKLSLEIRGMHEVHRSQRRDVFEQFRTELNSWLSDRPTRRVLVLLDEADKFLDRQSGDPEQMLRLRALAEESNHRFRLVIAGLQKVYAYASRSNSPFGHFARPIVIRPLDVKSALELVREPAASLGVEVEDRAAWQVLTITNRHPGLIQLFMRSLMESVFARKPRKGEPPYYVSEDSVVRLFSRDEHLRAELRRRFELTVTLDPKYQAITFAVARHQLDNRYPFAAEALKAVLDSDAPEGFKPFQQHDFETLLEELRDLGVLRIVEDGEAFGVRLATPVVRALLGDRARIKARYEEACLEDFSGPLEGAKRQWSIDYIAPSISNQQLEQILDPLSPSPRLAGRRSPIEWAFGTAALGVSGLPDLVKLEVSQMRDKRDEERVLTFSCADILQGALSDVTALKALALLQPEADPPDVVQEAVAQLKGWAAGDGRRGLVLVDESRPDLWGSVLSAGMDQRLQLTPWDEAALKAEKRDNRNWLDTRLQRRAILDACGGWPELLRGVLNDPGFTFGAWRQRTVERCLDPGWAEGFLTRVGLRAIPGMVELLGVSVVEDLDSMRDPQWLPEPWAWDDLAAIDDDGTVLDQLELLGVVRRSERVDPGPGLGVLNAPVMRAIGALSGVRNH